MRGRGAERWKPSTSGGTEPLPLEARSVIVPNFMRIALRLALTTPAVLALGLASAPAQAATAPACTKLKGKNLVPGALAKVVDVPTRRGGRTAHHYFLCPKPLSQAGRAKELKATKVGGALRFLDGNGGYAAVRDVAAKRVFVYDLLTRKRRRLAPNPTGRVLVGEAGEAATLLGRRLVGFDFDGRSVVIDKGPVGSIRRKKDDVFWTSAGAAKRTAFSRTKVPCARQGGEVVAQRGGVRVTSFSYSGQYLVGQLNGIATRTRACLLEGDPTAAVLDESSFSTGGAVGGDRFFLQDIAAPYVVGLNSSEDSESNVFQTVKLSDVRTGKATPVFQSGEKLRTASPIFVTAAGTVAMATSTLNEDFNAGTFQIFARRIDGSVRQLDAGPATEFAGPNSESVALKLTGTTLSWTRNGQAKSADLAG